MHRFGRVLALSVGKERLMSHSTYKFLPPPPNTVAPSDLPDGAPPPPLARKHPCIFCTGLGTLHQSAYGNPPPSICPSCRKILEEATGCQIVPAKGYRIVWSFGETEMVEAADPHEALKKTLGDLVTWHWTACVRNIMKGCLVFSGPNSVGIELWAEVYEPEELHV